MTEAEHPNSQSAQPADETAPTVMPPKKRRGRTELLIGGGIAAGVLAIGAIFFFAMRGGDDLTVNFGLIDIRNGVDCDTGGFGGYSDVGAGMDVVIRNNEGEIIGSGALQEGGEQIESGACVWTAVIEDLPSEDYYAVSVGRRGEQVFTAEDLEEQEWAVNLTLGGA